MDLSEMWRKRIPVAEAANVKALNKERELDRMENGKMLRNKSGNKRAGEAIGMGRRGEGDSVDQSFSHLKNI